MPSLSIIIPTYNRGEILAECLRRIEVQTVKEQLEVIVVSDGEPDKPTSQLAKNTYRVPVTFREIQKSQQGPARNRGVQEARGKYVLFIGDDMFLAPDCCEVHLRTHAQIDNDGSSSSPRVTPQIINSSLSIIHSFVAVLGNVTWDPSLEITPVMRWLDRTGWQFGFSFLTPHAFVPAKSQHRFTYTSNISLPTEMARKTPFKEGIDLYGWEDIEWGMRLREMGARLFYEPDAKVLHHHHMTLENSLRRMETLGKSARKFDSLVPEMSIVPRGWKRLTYGLAALLPSMRGQHAKAFLRGLNA